MKIQITYEDSTTELVDFPVSHRFQDLREYFKDPQGSPASAVEILSRHDEANTSVSLARDMAVIRPVD